MSGEVCWWWSESAVNVELRVPWVESKERRKKRIIDGYYVLKMGKGAYMVPREKTGQY
jgi:hypothetical protein